MVSFHSWSKVSLSLTLDVAFWNLFKKMKGGEGIVEKMYFFIWVIDFVLPNDINVRLHFFVIQ